MKSHTLGATIGMIAALSAIFIMLPVPRAAAANLDITPSLSLDQTYDSNVFNSNGNEKEDFILRVTPALTFSLRMPETTLNLRTSLTSDTYYKYTELNSTNSAISLAIDATPIQFTPRFSMVPAAHYVEAQDSFHRNQLIPSGDPMVPASIASESAIRKSRDYGAALRMNYLVTPKTDFSLGGGFTKRQFLDNVASGDVDSRIVTGDTMITYRFTPRFSSGFFFNTASNTFDNGRDSQIYSGGLTGSYLFSGSLTLTARGGISRAQESDTTGLPERTTWSPTVSISLNYVERDFLVVLNGSTDQSGSGSFGYTARRDSVTLTISDQITGNWWAELMGRYQQTRSLDANVSEDLRSVIGTVGVRYQVLEWVAVRSSGTALRQWNYGTIGSDLLRYSAFIGFTVAHTFNLY